MTGGGDWAVTSVTSVNSRALVTVLFSTFNVLQRKFCFGIELEEGRLRILEQISGENLIRSLEIEF